MKIWLRIILLAVLGLVCAVLAAGAMLPKQYSASRTVVLPLDADSLWNRISEIEDQPSWRGDVESVERLPDLEGRMHWRESRIGGRSMRYELIEAVPPFRRVVRIAEPKAPFGGTWTWLLEPMPDGGTRLTLTEDAVIHQPMLRVFLAFMDRHASIDLYLRHLERAVSPRRSSPP